MILYLHKNRWQWIMDANGKITDRLKWIAEPHNFKRFQQVKEHKNKMFMKSQLKNTKVHKITRIDLLAFASVLAALREVTRNGFHLRFCGRSRATSFLNSSMNYLKFYVNWSFQFIISFVATSVLPRASQSPTCNAEWLEAQEKESRDQFTCGMLFSTGVNNSWTVNLCHLHLCPNHVCHAKQGSDFVVFHLDVLCDW